MDTATLMESVDIGIPENEYLLSLQTDKARMQALGCWSMAATFDRMIREYEEQFGYLNNS